MRRSVRLVHPDQFGSLDRPPLRADALRRALVGYERPWRELRVVESTASTNADLVAAAEAGEPAGLVLVAELQTAGRGRLDRSWTAPPRSGLTFSVLLRPAVPPRALGWLPLLAGLAAAEALGRLAELDVRLKWPNDLVVDDRKLAGVLAERVAGVVSEGDDRREDLERTIGAVVVGIGLNVSTLATELPVATATSLAIEGAACTDRDPLLRAILRRLAERVSMWDGPYGDRGLADDYRARCATIGRAVRAELPAGAVIEGLAEDVDDDGRLLIRTSTGLETVGAGDVVHLR
jgi:BirA family biotin operon repressor/biotin-[acetyl-CoA-carboxylase] ligase